MIVRLRGGSGNSSRTRPFRRCTTTRRPAPPRPGSLVLPGRLVAGGVQAGNAVGLPVGRVAAAVHRDNRRGDALLQLLDLETTLFRFLARFHDVTSCALRLWQCNTTPLGPCRPAARATWGWPPSLPCYGAVGATPDGCSLPSRRALVVTYLSLLGLVAGCSFGLLFPGAWAGLPEGNWPGGKLAL